MRTAYFPRRPAARNPSVRQTAAATNTGSAQPEEPEQSDAPAARILNHILLPEAEVVAGPATAGIIIVSAVLQATDRKLLGCYVRDDSKSHGLQKQAYRPPGKASDDASIPNKTPTPQRTERKRVENRGVLAMRV